MVRSGQPTDDRMKKIWPPTLFFHLRIYYWKTACPSPGLRETGMQALKLWPCIMEILLPVLFWHSGFMDGEDQIFLQHVRNNEAWFCREQLYDTGSQQPLFLTIHLHTWRGLLNLTYLTGMYLHGGSRSLAPLWEGSLQIMVLQVQTLYQLHKHYAALALPGKLLRVQI